MKRKMRTPEKWVGKKVYHLDWSEWTYRYDVCDWSGKFYRMDDCCHSWLVTSSPAVWSLYDAMGLDLAWGYSDESLDEMTDYAISHHPELYKQALDYLEQ